MSTTVYLEPSELAIYLSNDWFVSNAVYYELMFVTEQDHPAFINEIRRSYIPGHAKISGYYIDEDLKEVPFSFNLQSIGLSRSGEIIRGLVTELPYFYRLYHVHDLRNLEVAVKEFHPKYGEPMPQWIRNYYNKRVKNE